MLSTCVLALGLAPSPLLASEPLPALDRVAPPHGIERWAGDDPEATEKVVRSDEEPVVGKPLAELHGRVVFLFAAREAPEPEALRLFGDLLHANHDRDVTGLGLAADEALVPALQGPGLAIPIGLPGEAGSPYLPGPAEESARLTVIGRSGEIAWTGNPLGDEKELLDACHAALLAWPALPLERDLDAELAEAVADYFAGDWKQARKAAQKAGKRAKREEVAADAAYLEERIDELEATLLETVRTTEGSWQNLQLLRLHRALDRGLPGSRVLEECDTLLQGRLRFLGAHSFVDERTWIELEEDRPVLFPLRNDAAGKRFAKKIRKLIRNQNDTELTRVVRAMLRTFDSL